MAAPLNILKMASGLREMAQMQEWVDRQGAPVLVGTRNVPRRQDELLPNGSIYWVFANRILCRQAIRDIRGTPNGCVFVLDRTLVPVAPTPRRAFQGWRYLPGADAPPDISTRETDDELPPEMAAGLADLGFF